MDRRREVERDAVETLAGQASSVGALVVVRGLGDHSLLRPIAFGVGLIDGTGRSLVDLAIYGVALLTMGIDWPVVRRLRRRNTSWRPWEPPRWASGQVDRAHFAR
jgi:hypothetical protein